jgi:hypothetical protein
MFWTGDGSISWKSRKQATVSLSNMEAKYKSERAFGFGMSFANCVFVQALPFQFTLKMRVQRH